ncbi:hypothetical protein D3C81_1902670 [compost metagenome]
MEAHWLSIQHDFAFIGANSTGQCLDERRFTRAVIANDGKDFSRIKIKIGMIEGCNTSVTLNQTACGKNRRN